MGTAVVSENKTLIESALKKYNVTDASLGKLEKIEDGK